VTLLCFDVTCPFHKLLCLLKTPSALPFLQLADSSGDGDRISRTESVHEEGCARGAGLLLEQRVLMKTSERGWSS
jgi:hypothetical protein